MPKDQVTRPGVKPLPDELIGRYRSWKAADYPLNEARFEQLAREGQRPSYMVVSCCDSRVHVSRLLGAEPGEMLIHRNIANLVPPYEPDGEPHGTSAALEFAVTAMSVTNLIVLGHSQCGGAKGCHDMCAGTNTKLAARESFVGRWMDILKPGYDQVRHIAEESDRLRALEQQTVLVSLENLMSFPFIVDAVERDALSLHGLWVDIGPGDLHFLQPETGEFVPV